MWQLHPCLTYYLLLGSGGEIRNGMRIEIERILSEL